MNILKKSVFLFLLSILVSSCGAFFNQPTSEQEARLGEYTKKTAELKNIPPPANRIVVGVYNFKDQTGQYKAQELGSTFSTAITQGATTILIKALEDSKWFKPIERENLGNLMQERNIIRTTRNEHAKLTGTQPLALKPLLFAGILLEGGVVSYDTNILTGGAGARYFGAGASVQYRQDRITIYLRAVSTSTGEILKTVYVSKTILSQAVDIGLFRYVNFQRLLEVETGFTKNEPTQLAIQEAIEKAVESLIIEGMIVNLWSSENEIEEKAVVEHYLEEKEIDASTGLYERRFFKDDLKHSISVSLGIAAIDGDYATSSVDISGKAGYRYNFTPHFSIHPEVAFFRLNSSSTISDYFIGTDVNFEYKFLPHDKFSPYVYAGPGIVTLAKDTSFKVQAGAGFEYQTSERMSIFINGDYNFTFTDELDYTEQGTRNDNYATFGIGLNFHF